MTLALLGAGSQAVGTDEGPPSEVATWDPASIQGQGGLSGGDLVFTVGAGEAGAVFASRGRASGKHYAEIEFTALVGDSECSLGLALASADLSSGYPGYDNISLGFVSQGSIIYETFNVGDWGGATLGAEQNDIVMIAVDLNTRKVWLGKNGTWHGVGDPGAGTGETYLYNAAITGAVFLCGGGASDADPVAITANFGATAYIYVPPAGFVNW